MNTRTRRRSLAALALPLAFLLAQPLTAQDAKAAANGDAAADPQRIVKLVRPSGAYADLPSQGVDPISLLLGGGAKPKAFFELKSQLEALAADDKSEDVLFDLTRGFSLNGAQMAEIERAMKKVRAAGKRCYAYLENVGPTQYQVAALCDKVFLAEMGMVDFGSPAMGVTFMKDALDLLGVRMDIVRCGDFKGAVEPFLLPRMSSHLRKHYEAMLTKMNDATVRRIAAARGLEPSAVRELQGKRLLRGKDALVAGLVDRIVPWEGAKAAMARAIGEDDIELVDALKGKRKKSMNFLALMNSILMPRKARDEEVEKDSIAVLHLSGGIVDGHSASPGSIVSGPAVETIQKLIDNDKVKGVVARINSPGGSATASEAVRRALAKLAERKPLVYSMGRVAGSGGYWITCIGRPILVEAATITGSIGVFGMKPNLGPLMRRVGIHEEVIALDDSAGLDAISRSWSEADKASMQGMVDEVYDRFLDLAAKSRGMARADLEAIAGGRVWSGEQAVARGLVDRVGGIDDAVAMVAEQAKLESYELMHTPRPSSFMDAFAQQLLGAELLKVDGLTRLALRRLGNLDAVVAVLVDALANEGPARVWAVMPFELRVR